MSLPSGYKRLEYIQSSGTQYIDTGVSAPTGMRVQCEVEFTSLRSGLNLLFGSHDAADPYYRNYLAASSAGYWEIDAYGVGTFGNVATGKKYSIDVCTISGNLSAKVDGTSYTIGNIAPSTKRSALNVYLFALNYAGGLLWSSMKLYSAKIYLDAASNSPARDFIPCKNASGVIGLWDDVNSQFYANAGTGVFTAGPEVAGTHKARIDATDYEIKGGTCTIDATGYKIKKGRTRIDATGYDIALESGTPLSEIPVGNTVKIAVNGVMRDWIVVNQGIPSGSALYDDSCNGTWLLMKDIFEERLWSTGNNNYANSDINAYLNGTFLNLFDSNIKEIIKQAKIPYVFGSNYYGSSGLPCKVFLLSGNEIGWDNDATMGFRTEGAKAAYFDSGYKESARNKRIAYLDNSAKEWWLRSGSRDALYWLFAVYIEGGLYQGLNPSEVLGVRPAMILPFETLVADDGTVLG